jgi:hypothetical protein
MSETSFSLLACGRKRDSRRSHPQSSNHQYASILGTGRFLYQLPEALSGLALCRRLGSDAVSNGPTISSLDTEKSTSPAAAVHLQPECECLLPGA